MVNSIEYTGHWQTVSTKTGMAVTVSWKLIHELESLLLQIYNFEIERRIS